MGVIARNMRASLSNAQKKGTAYASLLAQSRRDDKPTPHMDLGKITSSQDFQNGFDSLVQSFGL
jgi:hypothetical protein